MRKRMISITDGQGNRIATFEKPKKPKKPKEGEPKLTLQDQITNALEERIGKKTEEYTYTWTECTVSPSSGALVRTMAPEQHTVQKKHPNTTV